MKWLLDTNIVVFCLRGKSPETMRRLLAVAATEVGIPLQVFAELLVGAAKSANPTLTKSRVLAFLAPFQVVPPDAVVAEHYAAIRTKLESVGTPIGEADLWIAATAQTVGGTLVTNNTREFSRVPNLLLEDWSLASG
jgi:tRNA(fMet)-specific endonuclease VapC